MSTASPETIAGVVAGVISLGVFMKKLFDSKVTTGVPPDQVVVDGDGSGVSPLGAAVVAPVAVNYLTALLCFNNLIKNAMAVVITDLATNTVMQMGERIVISLNFGQLSSATNWMDAAVAKIDEIHRKVLRHRVSQTMGTMFTQAGAAELAFERMRNKIFQVINGGHARFLGRHVNLDPLRVAGLMMDRLGVPRGTTSVAYPIFEHAGMRSDVSWTIVYFMIVKAMMMAHGATLVQAEYVACAAVINLVGTAYGQDVGADWGYEPGDFGFVTPASLPNY